MKKQQFIDRCMPWTWVAGEWFGINPVVIVAQAAMSFHPEAFVKEIAYSRYISEVNGDDREAYRRNNRFAKRNDCLFK